MLDTFTVDTFAGRLGDTFRVRLDGSRAAEVKLVEARPLTSESAERWAAGGRRAPFALVFVGGRDAAFPQRMYPVEHDGVGRFDLFLVPIGPDAEGMRYEAVFT